MPIAGLLLVVFGRLSEAVLGSFRHLFDFDWPRRRYPGDSNAVRVICGRIALFAGVGWLAIGAVGVLV